MFTASRERMRSLQSFSPYPHAEVSLSVASYILVRISLRLANEKRILFSRIHPFSYIRFDTLATVCHTHKEIFDDFLIYAGQSRGEKYLNGGWL